MGPVHFSDPFGLCDKIPNTKAPCEFFAAIWAEARGANPMTQVGMAAVLKNRVAQGFRGAQSVSEAVSQSGAFSFTREDPASKARGGNIRAYQRVLSGEETSTNFGHFAKTLEAVWTGETEDPTGGSTFYYSPKSMRPRDKVPTWVSDGSKQFMMQVFDEFSAYKCFNGRPNC
jgi:spore germination cell wall hydrolase CwlJ-like protein